MQFLKKLIPDSLIKFIRPYFHGALAWLGSLYFGRPSNRLLVVGVTGTNGKTTTVNLLATILREAGLKTGHTSTAVLNLGERDELNPYKMTMPSGWLLQKWMAKMFKNGCQAVVLEVSSEGLAQNRHLGINFDAAVFTNLTPEHIESHGGFENYKKAKGKMFQVLSSKYKVLSGNKIQKTIVTNSDDKYSDYYKNFKADKYLSYSVKNPSDFQALNISYSSSGIGYSLRTTRYSLSLKGQFDVYNSLAAIAGASAFGISLEVSKKALEKVQVIPGRVEVLQTKPFTVVVDYAYEPEEMRQLYETVLRWEHKKIIQVLGPTGGGRDSARIKVLGKMAGEFCDFVFITTDDPYDEDPTQLAEPMIKSARVPGKAEVFWEKDRRMAIRMALKKAAPLDLVLITGKGADQKMALANGKYIEWDDRVVVKDVLSHAKRDPVPRENIEK